MSVSQGFRDKGNEYYKSALKEGLSPSIKLERLQNANNLYYRASETSDGQDEQASATKNLAMTSWAMAMTVFSQNRDMSLTFFHFKEALKSFKKATEAGEPACKPSTWISSLSDSCLKCWSDFYALVSLLEMEKRVRVIESMIPHISCKELCITTYFDIATTLFHVGINALQKGDYKKCLYLMKECYFPVEKVKELKGSKSSLVDTETMEEDITMHMCIAESARARQTGDDLLLKVLLDEENLNIEMVWEIIDWYRQSIVLTRDLDMEMEAIALSRLGRIYDRVLKLQSKAKECLMASVKLADAMHPRTFHTADWYIECTGILKRYQEETVQHEEEEKTKERAGIKEKMKDELDALNKAHMTMNNKEFLGHVYKKYPPKNTAHVLEEWDLKDDKQTKKVLQKAILHFHPDKVDVKEHGMEWKVLTEEITKFLTRRYECIKCCL